MLRSPEITPRLRLVRCEDVSAKLLGSSSVLVGFSPCGCDGRRPDQWEGLWVYFQIEGILSHMSEAIRHTHAQRLGRFRRPLGAGSPERKRTVYFGLKKEDKTAALGPIFEIWVHCFSGNSCDIDDFKAPRRSQSRNVDREIRTLWRAVARVPIEQRRAAESGVGNFKRRRSVHFLVPGCCYRFHQDRLFLTGSVVFQPRVIRPSRVGLDKQRRAISARANRSSANLTWSASDLPTFRSRASLSCFAIRSINAADVGADQNPARAPT